MGYGLQAALISVSLNGIILAVCRCQRFYGKRDGFLPTCSMVKREKGESRE